jgi:hypothetical protein
VKFTPKRRWRGLKYSGAGRVRKRLAKVLSEHFKTEVNPDEIWENRNMDLARWGVWAKVDGRLYNIHSWSTMGTVIKEGVAEVYRDETAIEIS